MGKTKKHSHFGKPRCQARYQIALWAQRSSGPTERRCRKRALPGEKYCRQCVRTQR